MTRAHERTLKRFQTSERMKGTAAGVGETAPRSMPKVMVKKPSNTLPSLQRTHPLAISRRMPLWAKLTR